MLGADTIAGGKWERRSHSKISFICLEKGRKAVQSFGLQTHRSGLFRHTQKTLTSSDSLEPVRLGRASNRTSQTHPRASSQLSDICPTIRSSSYAHSLRLIQWYSSLSKLHQPSGLYHRIKPDVAVRTVWFSATAIEQVHQTSNH